jgi:hypothetical protein
MLGCSACTTAPDIVEQPDQSTAKAVPYEDKFDIFVEVTADKVLVNGAEVASHDAAQFDASVERRDIRGLSIVSLVSGVGEVAGDLAHTPSLAIEVDPAVSAQILTAVIYSAPGSLSIASYSLIVGEAPPVDVGVPDLGMISKEDQLDAPPHLTLSPTWRVIRLAAFMNLAKHGDCLADNTCAAREAARRRWTTDAREMSRADKPERVHAALRKLAASYDLQRVHAALRDAAARAEELNGQRPHLLQVNLSGELPVSLYPELFALRCANWTPTLVEDATATGRWSCEEMVDRIVVNIVR